MEKELWLICLGAAYSKVSREEIMAMVPWDMAPREFNKLADGLKEKDAKPIKEWLEHRGVVWEPTDSDVIRAAARKLKEKRLKTLCIQSGEDVANLAKLNAPPEDVLKLLQEKVAALEEALG